MVGTTDLNRPVRSRAAGPAGDDDSRREVVATSRAPRARGVPHAEIEPAGSSEGVAGDTVTVAVAVRVVLSGARIVAGADGANRRVNWATTLRGRPPAFEPRGGGELVLAPGATLESLYQADRALTIPRILEGLATAGAVGLVIPAPAPADAIVTSDRLGLPLIETPEGFSFVDADRSLISLVLDRRSEMQTRASALYRELAALAVEGQGVAAILSKAASATGHLAVLEDETFTVRGTGVPPGEVASDLPATLTSVEERGHLVAWLRTQTVNSTTPPSTPMTASRWSKHRVVAPVFTGERLRGYVSFCGHTSRLGDFDLLAVSRTAAICALELSKEDAVLAAEQRAQGDLVDDLLRAAGDPELTARPAMRAGLSPTGSFGVIVIGFDTDVAPAEATNLTASLHRMLRDRGIPALCRTGTTEVIVICEVAAGTTGVGGVAHDASTIDTSLRTIAKVIHETAATRLGQTTTGAGLSQPHSPLGRLPDAIREAREAWRIGRRVHGAGHLTPYADLRLDRVLYALRDAPELRQFCDQSLGALIEYDRRTSQNLVATLEAFFACHGNLSQTAVRLQLHRNSLLYRIGRIQEVGAIDLEDPETRLALQVALKARRLLIPL